MSQSTPQRTAAATSETREAVPLCRNIASRLQFLRRGQHDRKRVFEPLPEPSKERLNASLNDTPVDTQVLVASHTPATIEKEKTVLYLAYGSNLCNETFRGKRGIQPLSQVNVLVPTLRLTFDLPGIPYAEPCFANTALRVPDATPPVSSDDYHKDRWHKGLVGVVYEVTLSDYAHIIATEGGGSSYQDILVDCYVLPASATVPSTPSSNPFKAHTLFAPNVKDDGATRTSDRTTRPDPSYAQPSARYLKLITDGAIERELPAEYQTYLHYIRPYTITTKKQAMGKMLFLAIWGPIITLLFALSGQLQDKKGRVPKWFGTLMAMVFGGMWVSYDELFKKVFGDGERTVRNGGDDVVRGREVGGDGEKAALLEEEFRTLDAQGGRRESVVEAWTEKV